MDGDIAPLDKIYEIANAHDILLMVDDAHGEGVLGSGGRGIVDHFHLHGKVDVEVGTLSKAFGVVGGVVAGNAADRRMAAPARPPVPVLLGRHPAGCGRLPGRRRPAGRLHRTGGPPVGKCPLLQGRDEKPGLRHRRLSTTPITPVMLGEAPLAQQFSRELFEEGVFAMALGFPTVPQGKARIRVMISAAHSQDGPGSGPGGLRQSGPQTGRDRLAACKTLYKTSEQCSAYCSLFIQPAVKNSSSITSPRNS